jgi:hypothetical protein
MIKRARTYCSTRELLQQEPFEGFLWPKKLSNRLMNMDPELLKNPVENDPSKVLIFPT